jgi:hypothetical protein
MFGVGWPARASARFLYPQHALPVFGLPDHHRDALDRLPIAHASLEDMTFITADRMVPEIPRKSSGQENMKIKDQTIKSRPTGRLTSSHRTRQILNGQSALHAAA